MTIAWFELFLLFAFLIFLLTIFFAMLIVFYEKRNPAVTWAWLIVILSIPVFGLLLYLLLGSDGRKYRMFHQKHEQDSDLYALFLKHKAPSHTSFGDAGSLVYMNAASGLGLCAQGNVITAFFEGNSKFDAMLADIANAKKFVLLQSYIMRNDALTSRILQALTKKAKQGVEVRVHLDGLGCRRLPKRIFKPLLDAGGQLSVFLPPRCVRLNFRNHRKLCSIDGVVGYIGGLNIGNEYLGKTSRFGNWRDAHVRMVGEAVHQITLRFMMDWNFSCARKHRLAWDVRYFPTPLLCDLASPVGVQIVSSGPDTKRPAIQYAYAKMIADAKESVYIQTPYFVPDDSVLEAIRLAALSGVAVRIMIPANPDHHFVYWAGLSYLGELLQDGVRCYQFHNGFVHSKLVVVDGWVTSVGTANMDNRSFKLNFETNAFIYSREVAACFTQQFLLDLHDCTEIVQETYANRPRTTKMKEAVSRLLAPML